ncbi:AP2 domain-containing protein [Clostridium beijerinckii]|jgi:hypothetical protein|uniref:AP2 domain-containing protein n=1 Tax=Clostridium beijerinckii TaxID=1520 RepID=UPI00156F670A|nr:AP2 domain-containing protein [Clostridium beijerinckii]NRU52441.1 hypothetical protein [Clostridium beijerinckii]NYC69114.1 hypothetical protein [Clostridium beijerinckii]NYC91925.1 hypothetical protein [Clostridium beijerinckii]
MAQLKRKQPYNYKIEREGEENISNLGSLMKIIKYNSQDNITILFPEQDYIVYNRRYDEFKDGRIKSPFDRTIYNIGFIGIGNYKYDCKSKESSVWRDMLRRCYSEESLIKRPTYKNCNVCTQWYNYQNFAHWWSENYYEVDGEKMQLDKDILIKGNKIYSPETCIIVPQNINKLFIKSDASRGEYPIGVYWHENHKKFVACCQNNKGKKILLGDYNNPIEAYHTYKLYKENLIKEVADYYKDQIPDKLYNAMINYKVEITD